MDDDQEVVNLTNLSGAVAVQHASAVEATIHNAMERDVPDERIHGLEREIWAIQSSLQAMDGERDGEEDHGGQIVHDPLQQAIMKERLSSLQKEYDTIVKQGRGIRRTDVKEKKRKQASLMEVDLFDEVRPKHGGRGGSLIETERDRLIRLGVLTPFDNLGDFEKRVQSDGHIQGASIEHVGKRVRQMQEIRRTSKLMDPSDLPKPRRSAKQVEETFWRKGAKASLEKQKKCIADMKRQHGLCALRKESSLPEETEDVLVDKKGHTDDLDDGAFHARQMAVSAASLEDEQQDVTFQGGYKIPVDIYSKLFDYQRTAIKWLWELHNQKAGGIMGDEMGLGKTIQITAFLAGLHHSNLFKPSLIVCPATMLKQWLRELREWYPPFRVAILHESARSKVHGSFSRGDIIRRIGSSPSGILITTYDHMRICRKDLLSVRWGYVVLDEGHKIRNPDAEVTLAAKQLPTFHRLILSGSPIQNRLVELWSLFDFVFPGKLGTLPVFQAQFAIPIQQGGYANASSLQVATAYKCAVVLRDMIAPYLLRRKKIDVAKALPKKTERILFCSLTNIQRDMYMSYLASKELSEILSGDRGALVGIDILRKISNHPDLLDKNKWDSATDYGNFERSGKMLVLDKILDHWIQTNQKALVFTQTQQMLDILEKRIIDRGWTYHRMDGSTPVGTRSRLIDDFNTNPDVSLFLLTTRVGGLGINLVGASKCVIYDPDWNPSTDVQARERAWRIGQTKEVTIYRLITSGTIEEKVYHRQVYKQFMTDKVLKDPRQKRFFKAKDLSDLFTLGDEYAQGTETAEIFSSIGASANIDAAEILEEPKDNTNIQGQNPTMSCVNDDQGNDAGQQEGDAFILKELFDQAGMHSALDHDKIEGAYKPENNIAKKEAKKIAEKAAKALRESRRSLMSTPLTVPTWTGRSGLAGAPNQPSFGNRNSNKSSSALLAKIRARNQEASSLDVQHPEVSASKQLADKIVQFLRSKGGAARSTAVATHFRDDTMMNSIGPELFKCVLQEVAILVRMEGGRVWKLKNEYFT